MTAESPWTELKEGDQEGLSQNQPLFWEIRGGTKPKQNLLMTLAYSDSNHLKIPFHSTINFVLIDSFCHNGIAYFWNFRGKDLNLHEEFLKRE